MARKGHRLDAGRPQHCAGRVILPGAGPFGAHRHAVATHVGHVDAEMQFDTQSLQCPRRPFREARREALEHAVPAVEKQHPRLLRFDAVELVGQRTGN